MPDYTQIPSQIRETQATQAAVAGTAQIGFALDRSQSMMSMRETAINGFNMLLEEQRKVAPHSRFSLALFNDSVQHLCRELPLAEVPPLTSARYEPDGGTALNDAVGAIIQTVSPQAGRRTPVLIAILTDGAENSSREFDVPDIFSLVTYRRTTHHWQFIFIGPPEARPYALSIGIPAANIVEFQTDPQGLRQVMARLSNSIKAYQLGDRSYMKALRG